MWSQRDKVLALALLGLALPAVGAVPARPRTLNFIEGDVSLNGKELTSSSVGSTDVSSGSVLRTGAGKAELLLTPGVFLRVGSNSEVQMVSAGLMDTRVALNRGVAMLEATNVHKENNLQIATGDLKSLIRDKGLYRFDAGDSSVAVFKGKVEIGEGDAKIQVKKGKTVAATEGNLPLKVEKFDTGEAKKSDELYQWSNLRSEYIADASAVMARQVIVQPGLWAGSGWYWNPWWGTYSWLPGTRMFYSPFGYGFYSPRYYHHWRPRYVVPRHRVGPHFHRPSAGPRMSPRWNGGGGVRGWSGAGRGGRR